MFALLLACTADPTATLPFEADVAFTVERGALGPEEVGITTGGVLSEPERGVLYAASGDGLYDLVLLTGPLVPGEVEVSAIRYRKGQQFISDRDADCSLSLTTLEDMATVAGFSCTGLLPEEDLDDPEAAPWSLSGTWNGGVLTEQDAPSATIQTGVYRSRFRWEGEEQSLTVDQGAPRLPWISGQWWTLFGTSEDTLLDLLVKQTPETGAITLERSASTLSVGAVVLELDADEELELTLGDWSESGTSFEVPLWEDLQAGDDALTLTLR